MIKGKNQTFTKKTGWSVILILTCLITSVKASVVAYKKDVDGVMFKLDKGLMRIDIRSSDIVEVKYTILSALPQKESLVVNNRWPDKTFFYRYGSKQQHYYNYYQT